MKKKNLSVNKDGEKPEKKQDPDYIPPKVTTYTSEEIEEKIGPARACSPFSCGVG